MTGRPHVCCLTRRRCCFITHIVIAGYASVTPAWRNRLFQPIAQPTDGPEHQPGLLVSPHVQDRQPAQQRQEHEHQRHDDHVGAGTIGPAGHIEQPNRSGCLVRHRTIRTTGSSARPATIPCPFGPQLNGRRVGHRFRRTPGLFHLASASRCQSGRGSRG